MRPKSLYLSLCILGTVLPYSQLVPFVREHGLDARAFIEQLFATHIGAFFGWDVAVSSMVLGVSLGLPLFLYLREARRELAA